MIKYWPRFVTAQPYTLDLVSTVGTLKGMADDRRPRFLELRRIALPVTALASILHRISGVLLFLALPLILMLFEQSLSSAEAFAQLRELLHSSTVQLALLPLLWGLLHHLLAGVRALLLDLDIGVSIDTARLSARVVNLVAPLLGLLLWWGLLL